MDKKQLKILTVGNSFGVDTSNHLWDVARSLGFENVRICVLYIGGCSLNRHYENATGDLPRYTYYTNNGGGWESVEGKRISEALREDDWDFVSIQHGTGDGSRYTLPESYQKLEPLIAYVKNIAPKTARIAINMAWVMASDSSHPEIRAYGGDQLTMYSRLVELTGRTVKGAKGLDIVSPTGTAVQNARTTELTDKELMRDGFHLSYGLGRYIASLTFIKALTGVSIDGVAWMPDGVDCRMRELAIAAANAAVARPFEITKI